MELIVGEVALAAIAAQDATEKKALDTKATSALDTATDVASQFTTVKAEVEAATATANNAYTTAQVANAEANNAMSLANHNTQAIQIEAACRVVCDTRLQCQLTDICNGNTIVCSAYTDENKDNIVCTYVKKCDVHTLTLDTTTCYACNTSCCTYDTSADVTVSRYTPDQDVNTSACVTHNTICGTCCVETPLVNTTVVCAVCCVDTPYITTDCVSATEITADCATVSCCLNVETIKSSCHINICPTCNTNINSNTCISGDVTITGNIYQCGSTYETHAEDLYTKCDCIHTRDGATVGLSAGDYTGIVAEKYNGSCNGELVFDCNGEARVGDTGDTEPLLTRSEKNAMCDKGIIVWNGTGNCAETVTPASTSGCVLKSCADGSVYWGNVTACMGSIWNSPSTCAIINTCFNEGQTAVGHTDLHIFGNNYHSPTIRIGNYGIFARGNVESIAEETCTCCSHNYTCMSGLCTYYCQAIIGEEIPVPYGDCYINIGGYHSVNLLNTGASACCGDCDLTWYDNNIAIGWAIHPSVYSTDTAGYNVYMNNLRNNVLIGSNLTLRTFSDVECAGGHRMNVVIGNSNDILSQGYNTIVGSENKLCTSCSISYYETGYNHVVLGNRNTMIFDTEDNQHSNIIIGSCSCMCNSELSIAIGRCNFTGCTGAIAVGWASCAKVPHSIAIGSCATTCVLCNTLLVWGVEKYCSLYGNHGRAHIALKSASKCCDICCAMTAFIRDIVNAGTCTCVSSTYSVKSMRLIGAKYVSCTGCFQDGASTHCSYNAELYLLNANNRYNYSVCQDIAAGCYARTDGDNWVCNAVWNCGFEATVSW